MGSNAEIQYSDKYYDKEYEYRHVILPPHLVKLLEENDRKGQLLQEEEWRGIGVQQSLGWAHYAVHKPEPQVLLFRKPRALAEQQARENQMHPEAVLV